MKTPKNIAFFGGTGGLGKKVSTILKTKYNVKDVGSKLVNLQGEHDIGNFFHSYPDIDTVIIFSNYNHNSFLHKYTDDDLDNELRKQIDINITGVTRLIAAALRKFRKQEFGRIIIASSVLASDPRQGTSIYSGAKAYYENLVKTICKENAWKGVTANCIHMGYMDGGLTYEIPTSLRDLIIADVPAKRMGTPEEIYNTIDFILNTEYINGTSINLSGGLL